MHSYDEKPPFDEVEALLGFSSCDEGIKEDELLVEELLTEVVASRAQ